MKRLLVGVALGAIVACSSSNDGAPAAPSNTADAGTDAAADDATLKANAVTAMHDALLSNSQALEKAAEDLQAAAPLPTDRGWDLTADATAIAATKSAWARARTAYEQIEGALAPQFPDIDVSIDARYDDFLATPGGAAGDADPFDDKGFTGMHAIERMLYVDTTPARVVDFEKTLPGYAAAQMPATAAEADEFKTKLCGKLIADAKTLLDGWSTPGKIDVEIDYSGLVSLVLEQREKVQKASTSEEESRYSQRTMTDLRDNLTGSVTVYGAFKPWILSKPGGSDVDAKIAAGFAALGTIYGTVSGEAIPAPPSTWSAENPSPTDLATPFGQLYSGVEKEVDNTDPASLVSQLGDARVSLGLRNLN